MGGRGNYEGSTGSDRRFENPLLQPGIDQESARQQCTASSSDSEYPHPDAKLRRSCPWPAASPMAVSLHAREGPLLGPRIVWAWAWSGHAVSVRVNEAVVVIISGSCNAFDPTSQVRISSVMVHQSEEVAVLVSVENGVFAE